MLLTGFLAAILALGSAFASNEIVNDRIAELYRVLAIGSLCVALATLVVVLTSPETLRTRPRQPHDILTAFAIAIVIAPGVLVGLGWFILWVAVPSILLVPLIVGWGASEVETPEQLKHIKPVH